MGKLSMRGMNGILLSVAIAVACCVAVIAGISQLLITGNIGEENIELIINTVVTICALIGGLLSDKFTGKPLLGNILNAFILMGIMLVTALIIDGAFKNGVQRMVALAIGCLISCVISLRNRKKGRNSKRRYR